VISNKKLSPEGLPDGIHIKIPLWLNIEGLGMEFFRFFIDI
jgi:hypothetical protein